MKTSQKNQFCRRLIAAVLGLACTSALPSGAQALENLGVIGSKTINASALLYSQTDRYQFTTTRAGNSESGIVVAFSTAGGGGYNIDIYNSSGFRYGSTSTLFSTYFPGYRLQVDSTTAAAVLPLNGLPAGTYTITVYRSSLTGTNSDYRMALSFPSSTGTGSPGGGTNPPVGQPPTGPAPGGAPRKTQDLNSDGNSDLVFQNAAGHVCAWLMNGQGGSTKGTHIYTQALGDWKIVAVADMNNDGIADLVFQNNAGQFAIWHLSRQGTVSDSKFIPSKTNLGWNVVASADMDNDGNVDLVFQNGAGRIE